MKCVCLLLLLVLPAVILTVESGHRIVALAEDEAEGDVDGDEEVVDEDSEGEVEDTAMTDEGDAEEDETPPTASPNADTTILFTKPVGISNLDLPAGKLVEFLVGFKNKGEEDFTLETLDASFRYSMDFSFYIQNFSTIVYNRVVKPRQEATLAYSFIPSETFAGRPFGLSINLAYRNQSGGMFLDAVFNETVQIVEIEEGLDGETFFLYVFLAACVVLLLVIGQQFLASVGKKGVKRKQTVETGTSNTDGVDYDWLPKETLNNISKSPRQQKQSPRQRKAKRSAGSDD